jgi:tRNA U34 5-carboxymethylaminomethyl modifying GTPase MnmE/TrmE
MIERQIDSPMPMPVAFVVKNESKTRSAAAASTPTPVSVTARAIGAVNEGEELAAEDLRSAAHALGRLLGQVDVEDVLEVIFGTFCIGK